jgi:hypothetical protein
VSATDNANDSVSIVEGKSSAMSHPLGLVVAECLLSTMRSRKKMAEKWKPPKNDTARGLPNERMPYLIEQPNSMARIRHMYTKGRLELKSRTYEPGNSHILHCSNKTDRELLQRFHYHLRMRVEERIKDG